MNGFDRFDADVPARVAQQIDESMEVRFGHFEEIVRRAHSNMDDLMSAKVYNMMYQLLTSSGAFDPRNGKCNTHGFRILSSFSLTNFCTDLQPSNPLHDITCSRSVTPEPSSEANVALAKKWLKGIQLNFHILAQKDLQEILEGRLTFKEESKVHWIMTAEGVSDWLECAQSKVLVFQGETAPKELTNAMSFSAAFLARSLQKSCKFPILRYFCGFRTEVSSNYAESGALALLNSLNSQLLRALCKKPGVDVSFLKDRKFCRKSQTTASGAINLLRRLAGQVPNQEVLFIIIDSVSRLSGTEKEAQKALSVILDLYSHSRVPVKVILTDMLSKSVLCDRDYISLHVPDYVIGGTHGVGLQFLSDDATEPIARFRSKIKRGRSSKFNLDTDDLVMRKDLENTAYPEEHDDTYSDQERVSESGEVK